MCYCSCSAFLRARGGKSQPLLTPLLSCRPALKFFFFSRLSLLSLTHAPLHSSFPHMDFVYILAANSHSTSQTEAVWKIYCSHVLLLRCCLCAVFAWADDSATEGTILLTPVHFERFFEVLHGDAKQPAGFSPSPSPFPGDLF